MAGAGVAHASSGWNAAGDFSATNNPAGQWSYGWSMSRGSAFTLSTPTTVDGTIDWWTGDTGGDPLEPGVFYNPTDSVVAPNVTNPLPPHSLAFHPGPDGENSIVRWTAPASGVFEVSATFTGRDDAGGTTTDVAVMLDGSRQLWSAEVSGYLDTHTFEQQLSLNAGETVDFTVGDGTDGNYYFDSTGLDASVSDVTPADTTPPTISCFPPSATSWYASDVTVPCTASDDGSGLADASNASFSLATAVAAGSENSSALTNSHTVCDNAGNCATAGPYTFMVDERPPTISCSAPPTFLLDKSGATVTATASDGGSGVAVSPGMNPYDAAALFWWARTSLFFQLGLDGRSDVRLCSYERLVSDPEPTMRSLYQYIGVPYPDQSITGLVHRKAISRGEDVDLDPEVRLLCARLWQRLEAVSARPQRDKAARGVLEPAVQAARDAPTARESAIHHERSSSRRLKT
jgi:hypothetical protein